MLRHNQCAITHQSKRKLPMKMNKLIKNGRAYPKSVKTAVLEARKTTTRSNTQIGAAHNVSAQTVSRWACLDGAPRDVHPNTRAAMNARTAAAAARRSANTPVVNPDGTITFNGRTYY